MQRTSKSPRSVTLEALKVARETLPAYSHRFSPHKFTQHQLFALLVLKTHQRKDYRGIVALLAEMPKLMRDLGIDSIPHYTTLQKASARLLEQSNVQQLLSVTVKRYQKKELRRLSSPRSTRRALTPAARRDTSLNAAKAARRSNNS